MYIITTFKPYLHVHSWAEPNPIRMRERLGTTAMKGFVPPKILQLDCSV